MNLTQIETGWLQSLTFWLQNSTPLAVSATVKWLAIWSIWPVPVALLVVFFYPPTRKAAIHAFLATLIAWQLFDRLAALIWLRPRFTGALLPHKEALFERGLSSFPSNHAAVLAALIFSFWLEKSPAKVIYLFAAMALLNLPARVLAGLHFPTDILAGILLGILAAIIFEFLAPMLDNLIFNRFLGILKKLKLG